MFAAAAPAVADVPALRVGRLGSAGGFGRGKVQSWIVSRHPTEPDDAPRIVALIDLEEGVRLVSNLQDVEIADVENDMPVEVVFADIDGFTLPQFRAARGESL